MFTIVSYYRKIKIKLRYSNLQFSALIDIISQLFLFLSLYSIIKLFLSSKVFKRIMGNYFFNVFIDLDNSTFISQNIKNILNLITLQS